MNILFRGEIHEETKKYFIRHKELFLKGTFKVTKDPAYETGDALKAG